MTDLIADLNTQLDAAFGTGNAVASWDAVNKQLKIESQSTGSTSTVSVDQSVGAASLLGFGSGATKTDGVDQNNVLSLNIDGQAITANLGTGTTNTNVIAATIQTAISAAGKSATVSYADGKLTIQTNTTGTSGSVTVTDDAAAKALGLSISTGLTSTAGTNAANNDLMFQIGANNGQAMAITVGDMRAKALGISGTTSGGATTVSGATFTVATNVTNGTDNNKTEYALDISSSTKATAAIEVLDKAIATVSTERSRLGAYQNRLEHTINNLNTSSENLTAAESRIRDVDMAKEMMEQTKNNILAQAAQAMLAQANQQPQGVLQLLR
ncbi:flagellin [Brevibacillus agri]|nr:flagellin [Brevibacillus agri]